MSPISQTAVLATLYQNDKGSLFGDKLVMY